MTQQALITRLKAVEEVFEAAEAHLDFCGYGDSYERECAKEDKLPKRIADALSDLRELIKEAEGQRVYQWSNNLVGSGGLPLYTALGEKPWSHASNWNSPPSMPRTRNCAGMPSGWTG